MVVIPTIKFSRIKHLIAAGFITSAIIVGTCAALFAAGICTVSDAVVIAVFFVLYMIAIDLSFLKKMYIFFCISAFFSSGGFLNAIVAAHFDASLTPNDFSLPGIIVQYAVSSIFPPLMYAFRKKIMWFIETPLFSTVWKIIWVVPLSITAMNIIMVPRSYNIMSSTPRLFFIAIMVEVFLVIFFSIMQFLIFMLAKEASDNTSYKSLQNAFNLQKKHFDDLCYYEEESARMRHDFRHVMAVITTYVATGSYDDLENFMADYGNCFPVPEPPPRLCEHATAAALLSYYKNLSDKLGIECKWKTDIPSGIAISSADLSILLGNLLENAVNACKALSSQDRYIKINSEYTSAGVFYLTIINSCLNTTSLFKEGIGLRSIAGIAAKYNGETKFEMTDGKFVANIMLRPLVIAG